MSHFNLRVYGILVWEDALLLLKESYKGTPLLKFPGGGVEYGEGLKDTLIREFQEELNLKILEVNHFYTQDFFVPSAFHLNEQIQTAYYWVECSNITQIKPLDKGIESFHWQSIEDLDSLKLPLPVDEIVRQKLVAHFKKDH